MEILIDGYNLLNTLPVLKRSSVSEEKKRGHLIKILDSYQRLKGHQIVLCFDAYRGFSLSDTIDDSLGIRIIYTARGRTCDDYIKEFVEEEHREKRLHSEKLLVVTSDREIINSVQRFSVEAISSKEFYSRLEMSAKIKGKEETEDDFKPWDKTTKKKGPSKRLSKKKRKRNNLWKKL